MRILLAEDEPELAGWLVRALQQSGVQPAAVAPLPLADDTARRRHAAAIVRRHMRRDLGRRCAAPDPTGAPQSASPLAPVPPAP